MRCGRRVCTTVADGAAARPADLVERNFSPPAPNRTWVADFTSCPDLVRDGLRRLRARRLLPAHPGLARGPFMRTTLVLDALEQAV